jgi:predicted CXXCH cytochrome family protein
MSMKIVSEMAASSRRLKATFLILTAVAAMTLAALLISWESAQAAPQGNSGSADSCLRCHEKLRQQMAGKSVHAPLKEGRCTVCHNPHASDSPNLIPGSVDDLCYGCHKEIMEGAKGKKVHTALRQGPCTQCHDPHAAGAKALLKKNASDLCLSCHEKVGAQLKLAHLNPPFAKKDCLSCHKPHYSSEDGLIGQPTARLCRSCHEPRCKAGGQSVAALTRDMDCSGCHNPHGSDQKAILNEFGHASFKKGDCRACHAELKDGKLPLKGSQTTLCLGCHEREKVWLERANLHILGSEPCTRCHIAHAGTSQAMLREREGTLCLFCHADTERRMLAAEEVYKGECAPVIQRRCSACHDPHGSSFEHYLKAGADRACQSCHKREHRISHPLGEEAIDPRNKKPMQCTSCHLMHEARNEFMLAHDGKRRLCIECHKYY